MSEGPVAGAQPGLFCVVVASRNRVLELVEIASCARCKHNETIDFQSDGRNSLNDKSALHENRLAFCRVETGLLRSCLGSEESENRGGPVGGSGKLLLSLGSIL